MEIKLKDIMGHGHFLFNLKSHKTSDVIYITVHKGEDKPFIFRLEREALINAVGAMK